MTGLTMNRRRFFGVLATAPLTLAAAPAHDRLMAARWPNAVGGYGIINTSDHRLMETLTTEQINELIISPPKALAVAIKSVDARFDFRLFGFPRGTDPFALGPPGVESPMTVGAETLRA